MRLFLELFFIYGLMCLPTGIILWAFFKIIGAKTLDPSVLAEDSAPLRDVWTGHP